MSKIRDFDTIMSSLGDFGKYQFYQYALHTIAAVLAGLHMLSLVTVAAVPDHRCLIPDVDVNLTMASLSEYELKLYIPHKSNGEPQSCKLFNLTTNETYTCSNWVYNTTYYQSSRAMEWDFVCSNRWMGAVVQSVFMLGVLAGAVTLGNLADKVGRKPVFCWSALLQLIIGVGVAFTPEYYSFVVLRFFLGVFGSAGSYITAFVLTMELVGPSKRSICGIAVQGAFACGILLVAAWGAVISDRMWLQIIYGAHAILLLPHWWLMDESPRWLWGAGRQQEAVSIIKKAMRINGRPIRSTLQEELSSFVDVPTQQEGKNSKTSVGLLDLFKTPRLRMTTFNVCLAWFANSIVYYGLSFSIGTFTANANPYIVLFAMAFVELPGYVLTVYLMDKWGRRPLTAFNMLGGGICCIAAALIITTLPLTSTALVLIGRFLISCSFAVIYNYSAELFPTVVRNSAMGLGSMCARISGSLTPLITLLDSFEPTLPSIIFGIIAILSGAWVLFLPETLNKTMPQTIEDGERFSQADNCFTACIKQQSRGSKDWSEECTKSKELEQMEQLNTDIA